MIKWWRILFVSILSIPNPDPWPLTLTIISPYTSWIKKLFEYRRQPKQISCSQVVFCHNTVLWWNKIKNPQLPDSGYQLIVFLRMMTNVSVWLYLRMSVSHVVPPLSRGLFYILTLKFGTEDQVPSEWILLKLSPLMLNHNPLFPFCQILFFMMTFTAEIMANVRMWTTHWHVWIVSVSILSSS